jgi:hypothetical protein
MDEITTFLSHLDRNGQDAEKTAERDTVDAKKKHMLQNVPKRHFQEQQRTET